MSIDNVELNDILDGTLDDLEDLPEFCTFPKGAHKVLLNMEIVEINDVQAVRANFKLIEHIELSDSEQPLEPGAETSILYMTNNIFGIGGLKKVLKAVREGLNLDPNMKNSEIIEQANGIECAIVTSVRKDKKDKDTTYTSLKEIVVL